MAFHCALNKGRGITPGYTIRTSDPGSESSDRSTKAEVSPPATHTAPSRLQTSQRQAVNKGRGITPGYTFRLRYLGAPHTQRSTKAEVSPPATLNFVRQFRCQSERAQQRPRYHPRLHRCASATPARNVVRSTKAEVSPPATRLNRRVFLSFSDCAQQRPRYHPRLHLDVVAAFPNQPARSTKAEVSPPATHPVRINPFKWLRPLNKGRGITPGYTPNVSRPTPAS